MKQNLISIVKVINQKSTNIRQDLKDGVYLLTIIYVCNKPNNIFLIVYPHFFIVDNTRAIINANVLVCGHRSVKWPLKRDTNPLSAP